MPCVLHIRIGQCPVLVLRTGFEFICGLVELQRLDIDDRIEMIYVTHQEIETGYVDPYLV